MLALVDDFLLKSRTSLSGNHPSHQFDMQRQPPQSWETGQYRNRHNDNPRFALGLSSVSQGGAFRTHSMMFHGDNTNTLETSNVDFTNNEHRPLRRVRWKSKSTDAGAVWRDFARTGRLGPPAIAGVARKATTGRQPYASCSRRGKTHIAPKMVRRLV